MTLYIPVTNCSVSDSARDEQLDIQSSDLPTKPLQVEFTEFSKQDKSGFSLTILTWHSFNLGHHWVTFGMYSLRIIIVRVQRSGIN